MTNHVRGHALRLGVAMSAATLLLLVVAHLTAGSSTSVGGALLVAVGGLVAGAAVASLVRARARRERLVYVAIRGVALAAFALGTYLVVLTVLGEVPASGERGVAAASLVSVGFVAVAGPHVTRRVGGWAQRFVYGDRESGASLVSSLDQRFSRAVPLDELLLQLIESLRHSLELVGAEVWLKEGGRLALRTSLPDRPSATVAVGPDAEPVVIRAGVRGVGWIKVWLPELLDGHDGRELKAASITHSGRLIGLLVAARVAGQAFSDDDDYVLGALARRLGLILHNVELDSALERSLAEVRRQAADLQASRARIVAASDAARRHIERDLHDGAQQRLIALNAQLGAARALTQTDPAGAASILGDLAGEVQAAISELRELAHGIYPPLLSGRGLAEALKAVARRSPLQVSVDAVGIGRYSPAVEATVYFCVLEALQNSAKHAGAARVQVRVWDGDGGIHFEVGDDGAGFDPHAASHGAGFVNMTDRVGALGGVLTIDSAPGQGTRVSAAIPLAAT